MRKILGDRKLAVYIGLILFLIASYLLRLNFSKEPKVIPKNQNLTMEATIKSQPKIGERNQIIEIGDSRLYADLYPKYSVGDRIQIEGFVDEKRRVFNARVSKVSRIAGVSGALADFRKKISENINRFLPANEAALVGGMVLGVDEIGKDFRDRLIKTGTIHVVVVSGQNLSIVAGLFLASAKYLGRRFSFVLATAAVFAYALLTGFEPPVVRASLMVLVSSIAIYFGRETIGIWTLFLAAFIILFFAPQALFEISFQLTFAATLGIMTLGNWLIERFKGPDPKPLDNTFGVARFDKSKTRRGFDSPGVKRESKKGRTLKREISDLFLVNGSVAVSAYLFTAPIILFYFGRVSLLAPVVNVMVAELIVPVMILGFLTAGASLIFAPLAQVIAYLAYVPAFVFVSIVSLFS